MNKHISISESGISRSLHAKTSFCNFIVTFTLFSPCTVNDYNILILTNAHIILIYISSYLAATRFGWWAPWGWRRSEGEIYISKICAIVGTKRL